MSFDNIVFYLCIALLILMPAACAAMFVWKELVQKMGRYGSLIFLCVSCLMIFATHSSSKEKNKEERVQFYHASTDTVYLINNGSIVTSNKVHIAFETRLLPGSAMIFLDYIPKGVEQTAENYSTFKAMTADEWPREIDFDFENALDYKWVMYTTYTPGPVVHTNGVAVAEFFRSQKYNNVAVPKRSTIWEDGKMLWPMPEDIARAKSKEEK